MVNRILKIVIVIVFCLISCGCSNNKNKDTIINDIISYNNSFDKSFLEYINNNYDDVLNKILDSLKNNSYDDSLWHNLTGKSYKVLIDYYKNVYKDNDRVKIIDNKEDNIVLSFVGDISLADNFDIMPYYDSRGQGVYGILDKDVVDIMKNSDIMTANNEFAVSDRGTKISKLYNFRANPKRLSIYEEMGVDMVSIANNHIYDYGEEAFLDTIKYLKEYDIGYAGGGSNIEEASSAFYYVVNGYKISFLSSSRAEKNVVTPSATDTSSGIFWCYDNELLLKRIKE